MTKKKNINRTVVVAVWKEESGEEIQAFSSLSTFLTNNPGHNKSTIESYISRKKEPYTKGNLTLQRCKLFIQ